MTKILRGLSFIGPFTGVLILATALSLGTAVAQPNPVEQASNDPTITHTLYLPLLARPKLTTLTLGYYTGEQQSYHAVQTFSAYLKIVSADVFGVHLDGTLSGSDDLGVVADDRSHGIRTFACVSNYNNEPSVNDFDPALAHAAIVTHKAAVISELVTLAQAGGYAGINIDFENLAYSPNIADDRAAFSDFIHELALQLHAHGFQLAISVPGKTADSMDNTWSYPFDFAALGRDADYLQLMTYDQHGPWSEPGPIAGADWVEECVAYATSLVNASRLLIGLPAYGYDWDLTASTASSFSWTDIPTLLARPGAVQHWNASSHSPSVTYTQDGHAHEAWYENTDSIQAKTSLVKQYDLAGLSMWSLGQEDQSFWQAATRGLP